MRCETLGHNLGRAHKGRRTGLWIQTCRDCGEPVISETEPPDPTRPRALMNVDVPEQLNVRGRMEKLITRTSAAKWLQDARAKRAGDV